MVLLHVLFDGLAEFVPDAAADVDAGTAGVIDCPDVAPVALVAAGMSAVVDWVMPIATDSLVGAVAGCVCGTESWPSVPWRASGGS